MLCADSLFKDQNLKYPLDSIRLTIMSSAGAIIGAVLL